MNQEESQSVCVLVYKDGQVLIVNFSDGSCGLPGGLVKCGEAPEDAAVRIMKEQTGLDIVISGRLVEDQNTPYGGKATIGYQGMIISSPPGLS